MAVGMLVCATVLALKDYCLLTGIPALKDDDYLALLQAVFVVDFFTIVQS